MRHRHIALTTMMPIASGALTFGWYKRMHSETARGFCLRPLHANLIVAANIAIKKSKIRCAGCTVSEANQQHKSLRLVGIRDYPTAEAIASETAWFIEESRAAACAYDAMRMDEVKHPRSLPMIDAPMGTSRSLASQTLMRSSPGTAI